MNKQHQPVWFGLLTFLISSSSLLRTSLALSLFVTLTVAQKWNGQVISDICRLKNSQQRLFILTNGNHSVRIGKNWWEFFISFQIKSKGNASNLFDSCGFMWIHVISQNIATRSLIGADWTAKTYFFSCMSACVLNQKWTENLTSKCNKWISNYKFEYFSEEVTHFFLYWILC